MHARHLVAAIATASAMGTVLAAAQPDRRPAPLVKEGVTKKVSDHTYVILDDNVPLVPNVGIIVGSKAVLVVDPGLGRANGDAILREVGKIKPKADLFIGSTHFHPEHTTGYTAFPASARYVNSREQEQEFDEGGLQFVEQFARMSPVNADLLKDNARRKADVVFDREQAIDLGGVHVRCVLMGPAHTKGDTVFVVDEDHVAFAGDIVLADSFLAAGTATSLKAWFAAFDAIERLKPLVVVPSHGPLGNASTVAANRAVMQAIEARARALKAQGVSADEAAPTIQKELQAQHPNWPRAGGIAAAARAAYREAP